MSLFVAPAAQCGPSATIPPRVHRVGLVGRGRDVVCRAGSLPRRRPSANALSIVPDVRLDDAAAMIFAENSTHDGKESDFSPVVMSRGTGSASTTGRTEKEERERLERTWRHSLRSDGRLPGSRRSERLRPRSRQTSETPARGRRAKAGLNQESMRHFLMETSVPLPRELTGEENKTPAMEFLIEKRLALEQGRLRSRGLQSGTRSQGRSNVRDPLSIFMNTIGDCALLSREEEVRLMSLVRQWQELEAAERRLEEESGERAPGTGAGQRMPAARLAEALGLTALEVTRRRWCGEEARSLMAQYNLRLVVHIAKRYVGRGVDLVDLIAEGVDGLFRAVDKFDHRRGVKFSTYSHWWVRQAMTRAITNQSRVVRLPVHVWDLAHKILRVQQSIMSAKGLEEAPPPEEVAKEIGIPVEKVVQVLKVATLPRSLDAPANSGETKRSKNLEEDSVSLVDSIAWHAEEPVMQMAKEQLIKEDINALLSTLPPRERNVIRMRYGLAREDGTVMTFNDIGAAYGLTRERIRQIEEKALRKLQRPQSKRILRSYLYSAVDASD